MVRTQAVEAPRLTEGRGRGILHVVPHFRPAYGFGGPITTSGLLVDGLSEAGFKVSVWTTDIADSNGTRLQPRTATPDNVDVFRYRYLSKSIYQTTNLLFTPGMCVEALLSGPGPRIVHLHDFRSFQALSAYVFARRLRIHLVLHPHGTVSRVLGKERLKRAYDFAIGSRILSYASSVVALSKKEAAAFEQAGADPEKIRIIANGVPIPTAGERKRSGRFRRRFGIPPESTVILFLGRLRVQKGVLTLMEAFAQIGRGRKDVFLVLCGPDAGIRESVQRIATRENLQVVMPGLVQGDLKAEVLADSDIFCFPSHFETQSVALLEAASYGLAIVATHENTPPEFIDAGAGSFVELNSNLIGGALDKLVHSPDRRRSLGEKARQVAESNFSSVRMTADVCRLYQELLADQ